MTGHGNRSSCRDIFRQKSQYIFSILLFVLKNRNFFVTNYDRHNVQTRHSNLYPASSLTLYQNGVYYTGIKIVNKLPPELKELIQTSKILRVP